MLEVSWVEAAVVDKSRDHAEVEDMTQPDIALFAHLLRRAGFGATREELEGYAAKGYEATVEELLHPDTVPSPVEDDMDLLRRYHVEHNSLSIIFEARTHLLYRMINSKRPLEEKIALFWHGVFATAWTKVDVAKSMIRQTDMFRRYGLGSYRDLLVRLSKDPAMIMWLDNKDNHKDGVNENYGRELLELFSMGVGNYTELDVREASRAFTGWTVRNASLQAHRASRNLTEPFGRCDFQFEYKEDDHDNGEKTFLGETKAFTGEEIIDKICRQPATARFIARHLYSFFVADEAQVPAWQIVPPQDPDAIEALMDAFIVSGYEIRSVLRVLFNSDFFKKAAFKRVKSPAELVVGTARLTKSYQFPESNDYQLGPLPGYMGQDLLEPPSVEGWHTGAEWINTANLMQRVNFASEQLGDVNKPGVRDIVDRVRTLGPRVSPEALVDACAELLGPLEISGSGRQELIDHAAGEGEVRFGSGADDQRATERIIEMLQLLVSTREYQLA